MGTGVSVWTVQRVIGTRQTRGFLKPLIQVAKLSLTFHQSLAFFQDIIGHQLNED